MSVNDVTSSLAPYPMEELAAIRTSLLEDGKKVYDFGTGDPKIPTSDFIVEALKENIPKISQYPSIKAHPELLKAIEGYCARRFQFRDKSRLSILPSNGSKEAVFHVALSLVGRKGGRKTILYPDPGYPVYKSSTLFAGGKPYPVALSEESSYQMEPWKLPEDIQNDTAALWINYPHNPTGALIGKKHLENLIDWCEQRGVVLLSDDCYTDIYNASWQDKDRLPINPLEIASDQIISFMSLSKRSGMTGYRSGFMVGDSALMKDIQRARANFGVATPTFIQLAAAKAWTDEHHVTERRRMFTQRLEFSHAAMVAIGFEVLKPDATFYLWCKVPGGQDDVEFCRGLAKLGVIASPSSWLGESCKGYFRMAMVPEFSDIKESMAIISGFI
jgi:succinyldiaminopimelate transaminase